MTRRDVDKQKSVSLRSGTPERTVQTTTIPPQLTVVCRRAWILRRFYKLYILPQELVCVWSGTAANFRRVKELETKSLEQLRHDHKYNFTLNVDEIESASLIAAGRLKLRFVTGKKLTLTFCTSYDAYIAHDLLSTVLGPKLSIDSKIPRLEASFEFSGKTVLFYDSSHGNQLEFLDVDGRCYLWYPSNPIALPGRWRFDGSNIAFQYGSNTFNPVTRVLGGGWEPTPLAFWTGSIVDVQSGDVCGLATGRIPYKLFPHPGFRSIREARGGKSNG